jgi:hypothetical protein
MFALPGCPIQGAASSPVVIRNPSGWFEGAITIVAAFAWVPIHRLKVAPMVDMGYRRREGHY